MKMNKQLHSLSVNKIWNFITSLAGFSFCKNPKVVYLVADNTPYKNSDGYYVLADSTAGNSLLTDTATYTSANLGLACYSSGDGFVKSMRRGTATVDKVLTGSTFTNEQNFDLSGTMANNGGTTKSATCTLDSTNSRVQLTVPSNGYYNTSSKLYVAYSTLASKIGLTAEKIVKGDTILGIAGTAASAATSLTGTVSITVENKRNTSALVTFSTPFASTPTITFKTSNSRLPATLKSSSPGGFVVNCSSNTNSVQTTTVTWTATV